MHAPLTFTRSTPFTATGARGQWTVRWVKERRAYLVACDGAERGSAFTKFEATRLAEELDDIAPPPVNAPSNGPEGIRAKKDAVVRFRLSPYQAQVLHAAAELEALTLSAWARRVVFREAGLLEHERIMR